MSALILAGQPVAAQIRSELGPEIDHFRKDYGIAPTLAVVRVGNPPSAVSYTHSIDRTFTDSGMGFQMHVLPEDANEEQLVGRLIELGHADDVHGILLQRPLPSAINSRTVMSQFPSLKDVEGVSPHNIGDMALETGDFYPTSTPSAAIELFKFYGISIEGKRAVVVGRSNILGKPMALLLLQANATVMIAHSHTPDLPEITRQANLLIAAAGRPKMITADMVSPGVIIVDFGVTVKDRQLIGDVDFEAVIQIARAVSPVPGGAGPVTTAILMRNTVHAAQRQTRQTGTKGKIRWFPILKSPNRRK